MKRSTVTASCGHSYEVELRGSKEEQARKVRWIETEGLCVLCYQERCAREDLEQREILEERLRLPGLLGTERQVVWAAAIRARKIDELLKEYGTEVDLNRLWSAVREGKPGTAVLYEQDARFWIDNRTKRLSTLMRAKASAAKRQRAAVSMLTA